MYGFHILVYVLCVRGIKDTQCGFKMFTRSAAASLFQLIHINRWYVDLIFCVVYFATGCPVLETGQGILKLADPHSYRAFDVELLYIAQQLGMPVSEVAVNWKEIEGVYMLTCTTPECTRVHVRTHTSFTGIMYTHCNLQERKSHYAYTCSQLIM